MATRLETISWFNSVAHKPAAAPKPEAKEKTERPAAKDSVKLAEANYPTVGQYVEKEFAEATETVADTVRGVAEVALPPLLLAEIAAIHARHKREAMAEVWKLPMDPQGKWKVTANEILAKHKQAARDEVRQLPAIRAVRGAGEAIANGAAWVGEGFMTGARAVGDGFTAAGRGIAQAGEATVTALDRAVDYTVEQTRREVKETRKGLGGFFQRLGRWIAGE